MSENSLKLPLKFEDPKSIKIYDLECLTGFFCYCDIDRDTGEKNVFYIHKSKNDLIDLVKYLCSGIKHVGFNNINYDSQLIHHILDNVEYLVKLNGEDLCLYLKGYSDKIINKEEGEYSDYSEKNYKIHQLDLFKIWHFDNKARSTRLKDLQIAMRWNNVQDMPIHHTCKDISEIQVKEILEYCNNDIMSTFEFYKKTKEKIELRVMLGKIYGINVLNSNDAKLGADIFGKIISETKNISLYELKQMRTYRNFINLKECIFPHINFKSKEFNTLLKKFKNQTIKETKGSIEFTISYKNFDYYFGLGGIHGCIEPGIYKSDETHVIKSCDVTSLYPSIAIKYKLYPEHLGEEFVDIYEEVFNTRNKAKKQSKIDKTDLQSKAINEGLKLALNGTYGKSNDENSFFYDPKFTMSITINGQLMLAMLAERLADKGFKILMINTDGLECIVPRNRENEYNLECNQWEKECNLSLEYTDYDKMVIKDVNNYISTYKNLTDVKYKGCFEIVKEYHKDPSFPIIPIALSNYFVYDIPIEDTIKLESTKYIEWKDGKSQEKQTEILDYAGRAKFKSNSKGIIVSLVYEKEKSNIVETEQQKTTRYVVTNTGGLFKKNYNDGRESFINKGYLVKEFNKRRNTYLCGNNKTSRKITTNEENIDINLKFYKDETNKILNIVKPPFIQLKMF